MNFKLLILILISLLSNSTIASLESFHKKYNEYYKKYEYSYSTAQMVARLADIEKFCLRQIKSFGAENTSWEKEFKEKDKKLRAKYLIKNAPSINRVEYMSKKIKLLKAHVEELYKSKS